MSYNINKSNSDPVTIPTGTIDNQFDIPLVGQDAVNWGDDLALAFVRLLENFAADNEPAFGNARTTGQLYYDTSTSTLKVYNGSGFVEVGGGVGKRTIWVPAVQMYGETTNGAAAGQAELTNDQPELKVLDFDDTTNEAVQFTIAFPKEWDESTQITYQVFWTSSAAIQNDAVWGLQAVCHGDTDAIDAAFGTAVEVTDTHSNNVANVQNVSVESASVTIGGTPTVDKLSYFRLYRNAVDAADTLVGDARLLGVKVFYTTDAATSD